MPKVIQYGEPQVRTQVAKQPRASAASGNAVFQANKSIAQGLSSVAEAGAKMVQRIDTTAAEEALVAFERDKNKLFFNPENGYFNSQGKNAYDNAASTSEQLHKLQKQYGENLSENARRMFDKSSTVQVLRSQADIDRHSSKGLKVWEVATINSQIENTVENASLYWNQPDRLAVQNVVGRQAVLDAAEIEGIGPEATAERLQSYESTFTSSVIEAAINVSSSQGAAMLKAKGDRLEGALKSKFDAAIKKKQKAEYTRYTSASALNSANIAVSNHDNLKDALAAVNDIEDANIRSKAKKEVAYQYGIKKRAEDESRVNAFNEAEKLEGESLDQWVVNNSEQWNSFTKAQQDTLTSGDPIETDWDLYVDLRLLSDEDLANLDINNYSNSLAPKERVALVTKQKQAQKTVKADAAKAEAKALKTKEDAAKAAAKADKAANEWVGRSALARSKEIVTSMYGSPVRRDEDEIAAAAQIFSMIDYRVSEFTKNEGREPRSDEYDKMMSDILKPVKVPGMIYGTNEVYLKDIPAEELQEIRNELRMAGKPTTTRNIVLMYEAGK